MRVLVIGSGGREHAMAWKLSCSTHIEHVYIASGNGGTELTNKVQNIDVDIKDFEKLVQLCKNKSVDYTIVGPEAPLAKGIVNYFQSHNLKCFGPSQQAAMLESSKGFAKEFLERHNIPTASYAIFEDNTAAQIYLDTHHSNTSIVIKADGLAAGKGVVVAKNIADAKIATTDIFSGSMGQAGNKIVIEECLFGEEASFIVVVDKEGHILPMATSQDHKRLQDGDLGPNTGGMGAYSPAPVVTKKIHQHIMRDIIQPTVEGMRKDGVPYTGFLYAGLMIDATGKAKVIEFNCRFGDPETQPILMRLESDFALLCQQAIDGTLDTYQDQWSAKYSLGVVLASSGYPTQYPTGEIITGLDKNQKNTMIFHAGTARDAQDNCITSGGRVLCVTSLAETLEQAKQLAYTRADDIHWDHCYKRLDIGHRAL